MRARQHGEIGSDDLYGLPLDRFVPERAALVRTLRAGGRRDEAAQVAGLRRPSIAAWAVNQLVRTQPRAVEALFEAGDELRDAQADLLAGRGAGRELRSAGDRQHAALDRLMDLARGLPTSRGADLSAAVLERVADTLHAAALDEAAREQVRAGRLERELRHAGLGLGEGAAAPPAPAPAKSAARPRKAASEQPAPGRRDRAAQRRAEAERARREREAALAAARAGEGAARRRAESVTQAVREAEEQRQHAAQALREAEDALATAREEATTAHAALRRAQGDLKDA
ncbi:MAG: hypothetical protein QOJ63_6 [Solirubrobacteraceae bacterium]|nr:hypothetical protein [Solirubrobacteraceae bacterium]